MTVTPIHAQLSSSPASSVPASKSLPRIFEKLRQAGGLTELLQVATTELRQILATDRVAIYQFHTDWSGSFIAESVAPNWVPLVDQKGQVNDTYLQKTQGGCYAMGEPWAIADIYHADLADYRIKLLEQCQAKALAIAPIFKGDNLWGLISAYQNDAPRDWKAGEIDRLVYIGAHIGFFLQQDDYLSQVRDQATQIANAEADARRLGQQQLVADTVDKIRRSLNLQDIFNTTTREVRQLLDADRVVIYRFNPDWSGEFIAESVGEGWAHLLQTQEESQVIKENVSRCTIKHLSEAADTYLQDSQGGRFSRGEIYRVCNDIYSAGFSDCYIQALERYQARAYSIFALYHGQKLWGLLAVFQNSGPRQWNANEIDLLTQISTQLSIGLQQAEYVNQMRVQSQQLTKAAQRQKALSKTIDKIRQSLDISVIFDTTTHEVRQLLAADRVVIYRFNPDWSGEFVAESVEAKWDSLMVQQLTNETLRENISQCSVKHLSDSVTTSDTYLKDSKGGAFSKGELFRICNDIYAADFTDCYIQSLESYQARAYAIIAIYQDAHLWGLLATFQNSGPREWQTDEIDLLTQVSNQLSIGLQQAEYLAQVRAQTVQLTKASQRQQALAATIDNIRKSLDIEEIFQTTTQEVRQLLDVDRVAIYRFNADWSGQFVADSISEDEEVIHYPQPQRIALSQMNTDGQYPRHETFVPISHGEQLWGLLVAYQTHEPRYWQADEISLLTQVGAQLGVALNQAELLTQTQKQAQKLEQAFAELQQTQAQLIQNEKMAGLGQLVAGIAHEINNPVNFIFGNVPHAKDQIDDLLMLVRQYQVHCPQLPDDVGKQVDAVELDFIAEDLPKVIDSMNVGAQRIQEIVQGLRIFSRTDEVDMKQANLHEGLDSTLMLLGHRLKANEQRAKIQVKLEYGNLPIIDCYPGPLNQVFMNLINNALDALDEAADNSPTITIRTKSSSDSVFVEISDNGSGMPETVRSQIFNPFFTTKPVGQGTGLGLSISYSIIADKHHGQISCTSALGQGTTFTLQLPIHSM